MVPVHRRGTAIHFRRICKLCRGLERAHLEGEQWKAATKVWYGLKQRGRREGVDSREGVAETDGQTLVMAQTGTRAEALTWYSKAWKNGWGH